MTKISGQVLRFGIVGVLNTMVGLGMIWLSMWLGAGPILANAIGYGLGLIVSFNLNSMWTFRDQTRDTTPGDIRTNVRRFAGAFLLSWSLNAGVVWIGLQVTNISPYLLQIAGMMAYTVSFFLLCRMWVFQKDSEQVS